jgi:hypothetical protein
MPPRVHNLTDNQRNEIIQFLKAKVDASNRLNKLQKGAIKEAAVRFECSRNTIGTIWSRALACWESGEDHAERPGSGIF